MTIRAQILTQSGDALDGASVTVVNNQGQYLGEGVKADSTGKFALTSTFLRGNQILVSYAGMQSVMLDPELFATSYYKQIILFPKQMDEVVVTPGNKKTSWLWLLPVAGIVYLAGRKKKTRKKRKR